jgi:O-antigen ligase
MKTGILIIIVALTLLVAPIGLLLSWIVTSPIVTNIIEKPYLLNPLFGSRMLNPVDDSMLGFKIIELFSVDRIVLFLLLFLTIIKSKNLTLRLHKIDIVFFVLISALMFRALFADNLLHSMKTVIDTFVLCYVAFFLGKNVLSKPYLLNRYIKSLICLGCLLIVICLAEKIIYAEDPSYRITGPFAYWETLGLCLTIILYHIWFEILAISSKRKLVKICLAGIMAFIFYCIFLTRTRTNIFSVIIGMAIAVYIGKNIIDRKVIYKHFIIASVLIVILTIFFIYNPTLITDTDFYQNRLTQTETFLERVEAYKAAIKMFIQNPILGIGIGNYKNEMTNYISRGEIVYSRIGTTTPHNSYLAIAAEVGLIGLIPLVLLTLYAFSTCLKYLKQTSQKKEQFWGLSMVAMTISYFLTSMTFNMLFLPVMVNKLYFLSLGLTVGKYENLIRLSSLEK